MMKKEGYKRKGINKKAIAAGAVALIALAAVAMVYYSEYSTATVRAEQVLKVSKPNLTNVVLHAPGIWANKTLGTITVTIDNSSGTFDTIRYRLIIDIPALSAASHEDLSDIRSIAIAVYNESDHLMGFLTPWTPTLVINDTVNPSTNTEVHKNYTLKLNGIAYKDGVIELGVRASVEILEIT